MMMICMIRSAYVIKLPMRRLETSSFVYSAVVEVDGLILLATISAISHVIKSIYSTQYSVHIFPIYTLPYLLT